MINDISDKNSPHCTVLYNSQAGAVLFLCITAFKVSALPGIVAENLHSSTAWLFLFMSAIDLVCLLAAYLFFRDGGDEFLTARKSKSYRVAVLLLACYLAFKGLIYFSYATLYLTLELFTGVEPYVIVIVFLLPVVYLGVKGMSTIARVCELTVLLVLLVVIVNLVFIRTDMQIDRNLPVFSVAPSDFFKQSFRYGIWLGDYLPLIFVKLKNKTLPHVGIGAFSAYALALVIAVVGISMYGDALPYVKSMLIRTAGFNQLSQEIGRMEWSALFAVLLMGNFCLSSVYWAIAECSDRVFGSKLPLQILYPLVLAAVGIGVPTLQSVADFATEETVGYASAAVTVFLSFFFLLLKIRAWRRFETNSGEYVRTPRPSDKNGRRNGGISTKGNSSFPACGEKLPAKESV